MNVTDLQEIWQVEAGGQIYEARFEELAQWIEEGSLLRQDKVRRGRLRWIEAQKVPGLIEFFNEKDSINFVSSTTVAGQAAENIQSSAENYSETFSANSLPENASAAAESFQNISGFSDSLKSFQNGRNNTHSRLKAEKFPSQNTSQASEICCVHQESAADYFCDTCANAFCKLCPSSYGGSVKICPFCGAMCQLIKKYEQERQERSGFQATFDEKFGIVDFTRALAHPFKFRTSLIFGAILFAVFSIGQMAAGIGGMFLMFSALFCVMASNMLTFGILANTVENFSQGKLETNFMPDFDDFSLWEDVVHPFFLSIAAYLSAFTPFILVVIIGAYLVFSSMTAQNKAIQEEITKTPGTEFYDTGKTARQSDQVKELTENLRRQNQQRLEQQAEIASGNQPIELNEEDAEFTRIEDTIRESKKAEIEAVAGKAPEIQSREYAQMLLGFLSLAAPLVVLGFIAFLWGAFFFPAACAVAGFTRSFTATINPLVGLDTIKRLGFDYVKILLMSFSIIVMSAIVGAILSIIFSPLDLPTVGNIPAKIIGSVFTFYFSIVFSCILGFALFKNSDKLKLYRR